MTTLPNGTSNLPRSPSFANLFKKYRLKSEIKTLSEFGDLLAEEGFVYETSIFTKWQNGGRVPKDRNVIIAMLRMFAKMGGMRRVEEGNELVESLNQRPLSFEELSRISTFFVNEQYETLPSKPPMFVERKELQKEIIWQILNKKNILLYGMPGAGKTSLSIQVAHETQALFPEGIFLYRADLKEPHTILDEILIKMGVNLHGLQDVSSKICKLEKVVQQNKILLILDNLTRQSYVNFQNLLSIPIPIICTAIENFEDKNLIAEKVSVFSEREYFSLANQILGKPFVDTNKENLASIGKRIDYLPISSVLWLQQIYENPKKIESYLEQINTFELDYDYDNKNLLNAINSAYESLDQFSKELLLSCAIFGGTDFDLNLAIKITSLKKEFAAKQMKNLLRYSFVESSTKKRYRIHPAIRSFLVNKISPQKYSELCSVYIKKIESYDNGGDEYIQFFIKEYENVIEVFKKAYALGFSLEVTRLWPMISSYMFYCGHWETILKLNPVIQDAFKKSHNEVGLGTYLIEDLGRIYFFQNKLKQAQKTIIQAELISKNENSLQLKGLTIQKNGIMSMFQNQCEEAVKYLKESVKILEEQNIDKNQISKSYAYLGMAYSRIGESKLAVKFILKALSNTRVLEDLSVVSFIFSYLGHSYIELGQYDLAEINLKKALEKAKKLNVLISMAMSYEGLSYIDKLKNKEEESLIYAKKAKEIYKKLRVNDSKKITSIHKK